MTTTSRSAAKRAPAKPVDYVSKARNTWSPTATSCISGLRPNAKFLTGDMRAFEDFKVGDIAEFGPLEVTAADIKSFAARFDPQPMHLDEAATQNTVVGGMFASGLHTVCMLMRLFADSLLRDSTSMGSPGVEEVRYLARVRAGDRLALRVEVLGTRPSKSRPEMGLVNLRSHMVNAYGKAVIELTSAMMFGRRGAAADGREVEP